MPPEETADAPRLDWSQPPREPCLVAVWSALAPTCERIDFANGGHALKIGRREGDRTFPQDITMSSRHAAFIVEGSPSGAATFARWRRSWTSP